jgi:hypothetical protein
MNFHDCKQYLKNIRLYFIKIMYLELSLYLNEVRTKFSSHKVTLTNLPRQKHTCNNTELCNVLARFVLHSAVTTIHLAYKQDLLHFNDVTVHAQALSNPITNANVSPSRTTAYIYSRNHYFLTGSTSSVVSNFPLQTPLTY